MVLGLRPFQYFFSDTDIIEQMVNFVEELPVEWAAEWERLQKKSRYDFDGIPGTS